MEFDKLRRRAKVRESKESVKRSPIKDISAWPLAGVLAIVVLGGCSSGPSSSEIERAAQEKVEQYLTRCSDSYIAATLESDGQLRVHQWIPAKINVMQKS